MSLFEVGETIRNARIKSGLTLEKASEGICTVQALNRVEKGKSGISPSTFHALMEHLGSSCSTLPIFENWKDYECFSYINESKYYLASLHLDQSYLALDKERDLFWNHNLLNYQEWLLTYCNIIIRTFNYDHRNLQSLIVDAISITRKKIDYTNLNSLLLSQTEIELIILYAYESLFLNDLSSSFSICFQLEQYIEHCNFNIIDKNYFLSLIAICNSIYLIKNNDFKKALDKINCYRKLIIASSNTKLLFEVSTLTGLCHYKLGEERIAVDYFRNIIYASIVIQNNYASCCLDLLKDYNISINFPIPPDQMYFAPKPIFVIPELIDTTNFSNGIYDIDNINVITFGRLLQELRIKQKVSQQTVCEGLCSKSMLSKIENGSLTPNIILAEALLQRLGISDREFCFFGDKKENDYNNMKYRLMFPMYLSSSEQYDLTNTFSYFLDEDQALYKQLYLFYTFNNYENRLEQISILKEALSCTIKDFNIYHFSQYRFTWIELSILNNIAYLYRFTDTPEQGLILFQKIFEYKIVNPLSLLFEMTVYPVTNYLFARYIYSQGQHKQLVNFSKQHMITSNLLVASGFSFYLCQSFFEINDATNGLKYLCFTLSMKKLIEETSSLSGLVNEIKDIFNINLDDTLYE